MAGDEREKLSKDSWFVWDCGSGGGFKVLFI